MSTSKDEAPILFMIGDHPCGDGYVGVIHLTPDLIREILGRMDALDRLAREDPRVNSIRFNAEDMVAFGLQMPGRVAGEDAREVGRLCDELRENDDWAEAVDPTALPLAAIPPSAPFANVHLWGVWTCVWMIAVKNACSQAASIVGCRGGMWTRPWFGSIPPL